MVTPFVFLQLVYAFSIVLGKQQLRDLDLLRHQPSSMLTVTFSAGKSTQNNIQTTFQPYDIGSVYFTNDILVATDWLKLLRRQSHIQSRGMMQFQ